MMNRLALVLLLAGFGIAGQGCDPQYGNLGYTRKPCPGQCVPLAPLGFDGPALLWVGAAGEAPGCPERAPALVFEGLNSIESEPLNCPPCACSQPKCVLPEGVTASSLACPGDGQGATLTDYPAPSGWDGSCTAPDAMPSGPLGAVIAAPTSEQPCEPIVMVPEKPAAEPRYSVKAFACAGEPLERRCDDAGHICLPSAEPPPPGFRQCIMYLGQDEVECPDTYPDQYSFFSGFEDMRECTECTCTQTAPSTCAAWVSSYEGSACEPGSLLATVQVWDDSICADLNAGLEPRSIQATWATNEPGACEATGGESVGEIVPISPRIFCCQPPPGEE